MALGESFNVIGKLFYDYILCCFLGLAPSLRHDAIDEDQCNSKHQSRLIFTFKVFFLIDDSRVPKATYIGTKRVI